MKWKRTGIPKLKRKEDSGDGTDTQTNDGDVDVKKPFPSRASKRKVSKYQQCRLRLQETSQ